MPFSMPMEVMPTCTVERNWVGCSISFSAIGHGAEVAVFGHDREQRALRLEARAISDIANTPLSNVSKRDQQEIHEPAGE
jgi:hypothetical protein